MPQPPPLELYLFQVPHKPWVGIFETHTCHYCDRYRLVRLELLASNERVDIIEQGIDVAIRVGVLEYSSLVARRRTWPRLAYPVEC